jgi:hypothetical protein
MQLDFCIDWFYHDFYWHQGYKLALNKQVVIHEVYKKHIIDGTCISFGPFVNNEDLLLIMCTFSKYTKETNKRGNHS